LLLCLAFVDSVQAEMNHKPTQASEFDRASALERSQSAIGNQLPDLQFQDTRGDFVNLSEYQGKPLLISLIYTSCFHICPTTTTHLSSVVEKAREALGQDGFNVVSIGFDTFRDSPPMMAEFARKQKIDVQQWKFLSTDKVTINKLVEGLGFLYFPSPNGFDHLIQTSIIDKQGLLSAQVYGMNFETPLLIEPLKRLVFSSEDKGLIRQVTDKIRLFCTVYDPAADKYRFDYSIFIGTFIGVCCVLALGLQLLKEWRLTLRS
jgi:protein SCO1/2